MSRQKKAGRFLNCYVKEEIIDQLDMYSSESMIPKTSIVEKALSEFFARNAVAKSKNNKKIDSGKKVNVDE